MTNVSGVSNNFFAKSSDNSATITLASTVAPGATTVPLNGASSNYADGDVVVFTVDPGLPTTQVFTGVMNNGNVINVSWTKGNNQTHSVGATVVDNVTATHWDLLQKGILVSHAQDGTLKSNTVNSAALQNNAVTTASIAANAVGPNQIANSSIPYGKIDYTTIPWAWCYYSSWAAGQVIGLNSAQDLTFDVLQTDGHVGITLPVGGQLQTSVAGVYQVSARANIIDVPQGNQTLQILWSPDSGANWGGVIMANMRQNDTQYDNRGISASATIYLPVGGRVKSVWYNGGGSNTRIAAFTDTNNPNDKYLAGISLVRVA